MRAGARASRARRTAAPSEPAGAGGRGFRRPPLGWLIVSARQARPASTSAESPRAMPSTSRWQRCARRRRLDGVVNAGGDLRAFGERCVPGDGRRTGRPQRKVEVGASGCGACDERRPGEQWHAVLRPLATSNASWTSVTVQAASAMTADALAKIIWALGDDGLLPAPRNGRTGVRDARRWLGRSRRRQGACRVTARRPTRLPRWHEWSIYLSFGLLFVTGVAWLVLERWVRIAGRVRPRAPSRRSMSC